MLVMPDTDGFRKNFPVITTVLIALNFFVFFGLQVGEDEGYIDALAFSQASGLLKIEAQVYDDFLIASQRTLPEKLQDDGNSAAFFWYMLADDAFQYELNRHTLIGPTDPQFGHWLELRQIFTADLNRVFSRNYAFAPARKNYGALVSSLFIHSSFLHLCVNMLVLWFVGTLLELGVGRWFMLGGYLLSGCLGSIVYGLFFPMAQAPFLGSAPALAGLVGMAACLFARVPLRVSHGLGFSFAYAPLPGWIMAPIWLVSEMGQLCTGVGASGAYVAHLGGLLVGLSLGLGSLARKADGSTPVVAAKKTSKVDALLAEVEWELAVKKRESARAKVDEILRLEPENTQALTHLFNIDKKSPNSPEFQATAGLFLSHLAKIKGSYDIETYFEEYSRLSSAAKVGPDVLLGVATSYIRSGKTEKASNLLAILFKKDPENVGLPACLFNLAQMYRAGQKSEQAKQCLRILCSYYPETNSGKKALELFSPKLEHTFASKA